MAEWVAVQVAAPAPAVRKPGTAWIELPRPAVTDAEPAGHARIGYARATIRPKLDKAVTLARELRAAGVAVTLVVHEHKRLGRVLYRAPRGGPDSSDDLRLWLTEDSVAKMSLTREG